MRKSLTPQNTQRTFDRCPRCRRMPLAAYNKQRSKSRHCVAVRLWHIIRVYQLRGVRGWVVAIRTGADQTVYLVIVRFGSLGAVYRETEVERSDLEKNQRRFHRTIRLTRSASSPSIPLSTGRKTFPSASPSNPTRCDIGGLRVPDHIRDFEGKYTRDAHQLVLRLI